MVSCTCGLARPAEAGAFLLPEGYGQFIAGIGFSEGTRKFDTTGRPQPTPAYRKVVASGYVEYAPLGSKRTKERLNKINVLS